MRESHSASIEMIRQGDSFRWPFLLLAGLPLTYLSFSLVMGIEQVYYIGQPTGIAIYYHVVGIFAILVLINRLVARSDGGRLRLSSPELLCLYSMMNIGACFACWESLGTLVPSLAYPIYMAGSSPSEAWFKPVIAALPAWAVVKDPAAAQAIFQGAPWDKVWHGWLIPLLAWGAIMGTMFLMYIALTRLLWDSWANHERLSFPMTELPLQITQSDAPIWRSRLFWSTFAIALMFDLINGLHAIIPSFPAINVKVTFINTSPIDPAQAAVGPLPVTFHPLMVGIGLLLRTDLLFSTWFFYLAGVVQTYIAGLMAVAHGSKYVFLNNSPGLLAQNFGAIIILGGSLLWNARRVISARFVAAGKGDIGSLADFGIIICGAVILIAALWNLGLSWWLAVLSVLIVILLAVFVCRLRAELGLPVHNLQFMGPDGPLTALFNGNGLSQHTQNAFGSFYALTRSLQGHPMPHTMELAYMTDRVKARVDRIWLPIGITGLLTCFIGPWLYLHMLTSHGLERIRYEPSVMGGGWTTIRAYMINSHLPDYGAITQMAFGAAVTLLLIMLGRLWIGSPFHPVGYAISGSWGTGMVWMPFLIAWMIKFLALRYGGAKALKSVTLLGLGLIFGEFTAGMIWTTFSYVTGAHCYQIWLF